MGSVTGPYPNDAIPPSKNSIVKELRMFPFPISSYSLVYKKRQLKKLFFCSDHLQCALIAYVRTLQSSQIVFTVATASSIPSSMWHCNATGFSRGGLVLVEPVGIEPTTSSLQSWRSPI